MPPNELVNKFFTDVFCDHGENITTQLTQYAKLIFASILKSVMEVL
jgi:hypothetical protein